jgi:ribosomal protein S18 acetylase RimI-like enzyme
MDGRERIILILAMVKITRVHTPEDISTAKALFQEYSESLDFDLGFQNFDEELANFPGQYSPPDGSLYLAWVGSQAVGCVGLRKFEKRICEIKRLYVKPDFRGKQAGENLAKAAVRAAKNIGYEYIRLDTLPSMESANRLYRSLGFEPIESYRYNPIEGAVFMELNLKDFKGFNSF